MIITRETEYAVRILRSLVNLNIKNIREISDEQAIPRQFAYKISKKMERAGFIDIVRGAQGGCRLAKDLRDISLMDLIRVVDKENMTSHCLDDSSTCVYKQQFDECSIQESFDQIQRDLMDYFSSISLYSFIFRVTGLLQNWNR